MGEQNKYRGEKIAVLFIHGLGGSDDPESFNFADETMESLRNHYKKLGGNPDDLVMTPCCWAARVQRWQTKLMEKIQEGPTHLTFMGVRKFIIDFLGDLFCYQPSLDKNSPYADVHEAVRAALENFSFMVGDNGTLCIIAHSLGSLMANNYIKECQNEKYPDPNISNIAKCKTLKFFYSLGCPVAVYSMMQQEERNDAGEITQELFGNAIKVPRWINFFDKADVIGYPLSNLNTSYRNCGVIDREVKVGNYVTNWNPASHMHYWKDPKVFEPIAEDLYNYQIGKLKLEKSN